MAANKPEDEVIDPEQLLINNVLAIISGKWRLAIILSLADQTLRYGELRNRLPAVSEKVLANELKALSTLGVISRKAYAEVPPRVEYALSKRGLLALPALTKLKEVGQLFSQMPDDTITN